MPGWRSCPITGSGEVGGSDAYHGPDDLLPPESLVTHATVPTRPLRHKRFSYLPRLAGFPAAGFGEYASRWFLVAGAAAALVMAMAKVDYFWIANVIYLGFVLWAVAGSARKLMAYRRGL